MAHITAEKTYSVKKNVQDPQIPDSRYFLSSQIPDLLGFNSQIPDFFGLYSLIPDADSPPPPPPPSWPDTARGTSIVVSTCAPSTFAHTDIAKNQHPPSSTHQQTPSSAHHTESVSTMDTDVRASNTDYQSDEILVKIDTVPDTLVKIDTVPDTLVKIDTVPDIIVKTDTVPVSTWDLQDARCILSMKNECSIDVKGFRFFTMERLFYELLTLGDKKFIRQLAKYKRMDYVRKCVNTRFELAPTTLQDKWLDEQTWTQIITARILSDTAFKQALLDSAGSPLCEPDDPVYATALTSARKMCVEQKQLSWPTWITLPTHATRGQVRS